MDNAEVYLIMLRPTTRAPVAGEAVAAHFEGQVELKNWVWSFHNEHERKSAESNNQAFYEQQYKLMRSNSIGLRRQFADQDLRRDLARAKVASQKDATDPADATERYADAVETLLTEHNAKMDELLGNDPEKSFKDLESDARDAQVTEAERNKNFEFTFTKRVDVATTQLLNSMKAGDIFPSGTLTIHQRSSNSGLSLVINLQKIRLLDYALRVDVSDTMTDMLEEWTAEFGALAYVYKNRRATGEQSSTAQTVAKAATQGTVRAFTMLTAGSPL